MTRATRLTQLPDEVASDCELSLLGTDVVFGDDAEVSLVKGAGQVWTVRLNARQSLASRPELAELAIQDGFLTFEWKRSAASIPAASRLKYCLLKIESSGRSAACGLGTPLALEPARVDLLAPHPRLILPLELRSLPAAEHMRVQLVFDRFPRNTVEPVDGMRLDGAGLVKLFLTDQVNDESPGIEIETRFERRDKLEVSLRCFGFPQMLVAGIEDEDRTELSSKSLAEKRKENHRANSNLEQRKRQLEQRKTDTNNQLKRTLTQQQDPVVRGRMVEEARKTLDRLEEQIEEVDGDLRAVQLREKWRTEITQQLATLEKKGRVLVRIYIEIDGQQVDIATAETSQRGV